MTRELSLRPTTADDGLLIVGRRGKRAAEAPSVGTETRASRCLAAVPEPERFGSWYESWLVHDAASAIRFMTDEVSALPVEAA